MRSIKAKVTQWILHLLNEEYIDFVKESLDGHYHYFKIEGFCDEPEIFLMVNKDGLAWGYDTIRWDGPATPVPIIRIIRKLSWNDLKDMNIEERQKIIVETMIKAINSKKREYRRCQYCNQKTHHNNFYDQTTCMECAEKHLGIFIVY